MISMIAAAVFASTPFYQPPPPTAPLPSRASNPVPHVMPDHRRGARHRGGYGGGYIDGIYTPDGPDIDNESADESQPAPVVIYRPVLPRPIEEKKVFPTYSTIEIHGAPLDNGCTYKAVMTDDEINACKRAARSQLSEAK